MIVVSSDTNSIGVANSDSNSGSNTDSFPGAKRSSSFGVAAPSVSLPKGGGAIRGMGEKFAANPVTGTSGLTLPILTSPGRSEFGPQLAVSYDSGAGNGPFGFGWTLSLPSITRKTNKGLPKYNDASQSDVFILSGAEDLVPVLTANGATHRDEASAGYAVECYRPRIEGLFARIERWTRRNDGDVHWRSLSKDNILTLYGKDINSRIADPNDPTRIFSWLLCETRDDKGNVVLYDYKHENGDRFDRTHACERNRGGPDDPSRTANRYIKRIRYGNRVALLDAQGHRPHFLADLPAAKVQVADWMFEVVFDYGEHPGDAPTPSDNTEWDFREDPFSTYRDGFEVRTTRLCKRVLMFHHFPDEAEVGKDCLARSTDFLYSHQREPVNPENPIYTFLVAATQTCYKRQGTGYVNRSLPPVELEYSRPVVQDTVEVIDSDSLANLPIGVDGANYQWTDLHGEGIPGILSEQAGWWTYQRNISPISHQPVEFEAIERVSVKPSLALSDGAQFMDLAGDGQSDLVVLDGPMPGLFQHDADEGWQSFRPFTSRLNRNWNDPNVKFVDLDGDGRSDVLIIEGESIVWHSSLAEEGFGPACRVVPSLDEEHGPQLVFADGTQSIYLADMSGDGLSDLVRIRNGEVCYWPNLGYGRFAAKISMDNAPLFDNPDQFDQKRIRLADIDGSGTTDLIYVHREGVRIYFNQSGNSWSPPRHLNVFPRVDDLVNISTADLLGNGTACLVWSSSLPGDSGRPMRYVNLMGGQKPHLLIRTVNNLGAETRLQYAASTKFYLQDKYAGKPWITRLPFPVHVVERVETYDQISRNRFATRYAYHHGYFDGHEREFRGFGMVEQWDTEELGALTADGSMLPSTNNDLASHVPPVLTRTWYHTGVYVDRQRVSDYFSGSNGVERTGEYYREPGMTEAEYRAYLLADTLLPPDLTAEEEREACRSLKGAMLRQEVYALDGTAKEPHPYTVMESNFNIRCLQRQSNNRHAVFFTFAREAVTYHYERNPVDPRIQHAITLDVDDYGNVLKQVAIGYGRRKPDLKLPTQFDRDKQTQVFITYSENRVTNPIDFVTLQSADYLTPRPCESKTFELTGFVPENGAARFSFAEWTRDSFSWLATTQGIPFEQLHDPSTRQKRIIEHIRTVYRKDDFTAMLPLGQVEPRAFPGESYKLAFTPGLLTQVFERAGEALLPELAIILGAGGNDRGGYVLSQQLKANGTFPGTDQDNCWWLPSGHVFFSTGANDSPEQELEFARKHFFQSHRFRTPFHTDDHNTESVVTYDEYDLFVVDTRDAIGNRVTVGERKLDDSIDLSQPGMDYRVLQPRCMMDPNRNRSRVAFDILGMVVGTAVLGKPEENFGDSLDGFIPDLSDSKTSEHLANPLVNPQAILGRATSRMVYDLFAYYRSKDSLNPQPATVYAITRETHDADLEPGQLTKVRHGFSYSDGFGREIQKKVQAESGSVTDNGPVVESRWVATGWTIFNNKGKPVRQYEPFFTATHRFEFGVEVGVSPVLFYDPVERIVAMVLPNNTYSKVVFDPWQQTTFDANDTVLYDPRTDSDIQGVTGSYFANLPNGSTWHTWHAQRSTGALGAEEQTAASKAAAHADTPSIAYMDSLGRPFLTQADNGPDPDNPGQHLLFASRVELDIEGNQRSVRDAIVQAGDPLGRIVMRYSYDMLGTRIHQISMEAGSRWMLGDVAGNPIRAWNSRGYSYRTEYDRLRRVVRSFVTGTDSSQPSREIRTDRMVYGDQHPDAETLNLRGKMFLQCDQAGVVTTDRFDFKGNLLRSSRRIAGEYKQAIDWAAVDATIPADAAATVNLNTLETSIVPMVETDIYFSSSLFDAINRPVASTSPDGSVFRPRFNEANLLECVDVNLRGATSNGEPVWTPFVTNIDYDAKSQRQRIDYGNGVRTTYKYDPLTYRLTHLLTRRDLGKFPDDCPQPSPAGWPGCQLQNLSYTYDPVGNITQIRDDAQQTIFFRNKRVEPTAEYTYDAIYRLIEATGREHLGQINGAPIPHSPNDAPRAGRLWSENDGNAMGTYVENYLYDAIGNFFEMKHRGSSPVHAGWTRSYAYNETSLIEDGTGGIPQKTSNRLSNTVVAGVSPALERYDHDDHGNMTFMPHLGGSHPEANMHWDHRDQLCRAELSGGGTSYYTYDADGQRVRKVIERSANLAEERFYLGGFEIYRRRQGAELLERETLHVMDDTRRIAMVETRTVDSAGDDKVPQQLIRYQLANHLGSTSLELDDLAGIMSYEEYTPYGSTSYHGVNSDTDLPKRYRFTGIERDEESGFDYHGLRHYCWWLARWVCADPLGIAADGPCLYWFAVGNPLTHTDPSGGSVVEVGPSQTEIPRQALNGDMRSPIEPAPESGPVTPTWEAEPEPNDAPGASEEVKSSKSAREYVNEFVDSPSAGVVVGGMSHFLFNAIAPKEWSEFSSGFLNGAGVNAIPLSTDELKSITKNMVENYDVTGMNMAMRELESFKKRMSGDFRAWGENAGSASGMALPTPKLKIPKLFKPSTPKRPVPSEHPPIGTSRKKRPSKPKKSRSGPQREHLLEWELFDDLHSDPIRLGDEMSGYDFAYPKGERFDWLNQAFFGHTEGKVLSDLNRKGLLTPGRSLRMTGRLPACPNCRQLLKQASEKGVEILYHDSKTDLFYMFKGGEMRQAFFD